jgi:hypothetical protein
MIAADLIAALELPASCRVDQRVPKKLLVENGAPTTADKRNITDGIEEIQWVATLKPATMGVPEYRDEAREYLEVAVLHIVLRPDAKAARIAELTHRAVPYPLLLLLAAPDGLTLSMAHIRWAQNDASKVVLDGALLSVALASAQPLSAVEVEFIRAIAISRQSRISLYAFYQSWMDLLVALQAARVTNQFVTSTTPEQAAARRSALQLCADINEQISRLRSSAAKENQLARRVEMNRELQHLQSDLATATRQLMPPGLM